MERNNPPEWAVCGDCKRVEVRVDFYCTLTNRRTYRKRKACSHWEHCNGHKPGAEENPCDRCLYGVLRKVI